VRFGKRSNGWAAAGRRLFGEPEAGAPVDFTSDDAIGGMAPEPSAEESMPVTADEPLIAGDPTQRLLTALGRFQRQVASAETGNARDGWADESMHQLINAIEIAIGENWDDIREALTDTARILQTYEDANAVRKCLPFLQDSYEILCLMVGDLIVGNVRSGVLQKWRERYELAVAMVLRDGLTLVEDDGEQAAAEEDPYAEATYPDQESYDVALEGGAEDHSTYADHDSESFEPEDVAADVLNEPLASLAMESAPFDEPDAFEHSPVDASPLPSLDEEIDAVDEALDPALVIDSAESFEPLSPMPLPGEGYSEGLETFDRSFQAADTSAAAQEAEGQTYDEEEEGFILEPLADERARATAQDALALEAAIAEDAHSDAMDSELAVPVINASVLDESDYMIGGEMADAATDEETAPEATAAVESADEADREEDATDDDSAAEVVEDIVEVSEEDDLATVVEDEAPVETPVAVAAVTAAAPEPEPEPAAGTSEALLRTAQVAMRAGNVADAKRLALQLAANMAKLEAEQVQEEVEGLEACLLEDSHRIAESEASVAECEKTLQDRQWHIGEREASIQEKHGQLGGLRENLSGIEQGIADLDEQIRLLQERRDAEARHAEAVQQEIAQAETEEAHLQEDLNQLLEDKARAEQSLETAQQQVAQFLSIQRTHETEVAEAREELLRRLVAVEEIEKTIPPSAKAETPQTEGEGLLF
jgi:predicted  nucleic acid-binding Zn-ribbon protein